MIETALGVVALAVAIAVLGLGIGFAIVFVASAVNAVTGRSK